MSICFIVDVMCDGEGCIGWIQGTVQYHNTSGTQKLARKKAKKSGWKHIDGKDYCPECSKRKG